MKKLFCISALLLAMLPAQQTGSWFTLSNKVVTQVHEVPFVYASSWILWMAEDLASFQRNLPPNPAGMVPYIITEEPDGKQAVPSVTLFETRTSR